MSLVRTVYLQLNPRLCKFEVFTHEGQNKSGQLFCYYSVQMFLILAVPGWTRKHLPLISVNLCEYVYMIIDKSLHSCGQDFKLYKLDKTQHDKLLRDSIKNTYYKASTDATNIINSQAKSIVKELNFDNRKGRIAKQQAFITLKDHKDNFINHPTCRIINPQKMNSEKSGNKSSTILTLKSEKRQSSTGGSRSNQLFHQHTQQARAFLGLVRHRHLSVTHPSQNLYPPKLSHTPRIIQQAVTETLPQITFISQRDRLDQEKPHQHVRRDYGQL